MARTPKTKTSAEAAPEGVRRVRAKWEGYVKPYGEPRNRSIRVGEEFLHEGDLAKWMEEVEPAAEAATAEEEAK